MHMQIQVSEVKAIEVALAKAGFYYQEPVGHWSQNLHLSYQEFCAVKLLRPDARQLLQPHCLSAIPAELLEMAGLTGTTEHTHTDLPVKQEQSDEPQAAPELSEPSSEPQGEQEQSDEPQAAPEQPDELATEQPNDPVSELITAPTVAPVVSSTAKRSSKKG